MLKTRTLAVVVLALAVLVGGTIGTACAVEPDTELAEPPPATLAETTTTAAPIPSTTVAAPETTTTVAPLPTTTAAPTTTPPPTSEPEAPAAVTVTALAMVTTTTSTPPQPLHVEDFYLAADGETYYVEVSGAWGTTYCEAHLLGADGRRTGEWTNELLSGEQDTVTLSLWDYDRAVVPDAVEVECQ